MLLFFLCVGIRELTCSLHHHPLCKKASNHHANLPLEMYSLHCNHQGNTWKPLVLMTRHFDYCPSASEGDNQSARSSAPVVSRCFPGGYNVKLYISRGRLAWWLLTFLHSVHHHLSPCFRKEAHARRVTLYTNILPPPAYWCLLNWMMYTSLLTNLTPITCKNPSYFSLLTHICGEASDCDVTLHRQVLPPLVLQTGFCCRGCWTGFTRTRAVGKLIRRTVFTNSICGLHT